MENEIKIDLAFTTGKLLGIIGREDARAYLIDSGVSEGELATLRIILLEIGKTFYR